MLLRVHSINGIRLHRSFVTNLYYRDIWATGVLDASEYFIQLYFLTLQHKIMNAKTSDFFELIPLLSFWNKVNQTCAEFHIFYWYKTVNWILYLFYPIQSIILISHFTVWASRTDIPRPLSYVTSPQQCLGRRYCVTSQKNVCLGG